MQLNFERGEAKSQPFTIPGENILLREFMPEDLDDFYTLTTQPHIREFLPDWYVERETRRVWLNDYEIPGNQDFLHHAEHHGQIGDRMLRLAVIERASGRFIGWCCTGIKDELPSPNREVVYGLAADCRGRGYMIEAVNALTNWLFAHTDTRTLNGLALLANTASNRVLQKCGFIRLGDIELADGVYSHYQYAKRRSNEP